MYSVKKKEKITHSILQIGGCFQEIFESLPQGFVVLLKGLVLRHVNSRGPLGRLHVLKEKKNITKMAKKQ